jgi:valyl-tRNA synthetase
MPFITEELWNANERPYDLIVAKWPEPQASLDPDARDELETLISAVINVRSARADLNIPPREQLDAVFVPRDEKGAHLYDQSAVALNRLARLKSDCGPILDEHEIREWVIRELGASIQVPLQHGVIAMKVEGVIDLDAERVRLSKAAEAAEKERDSLAQRLANPAFTERAKADAVEKARADHVARALEAEHLRAALERLG